jgi:hypothetical protein
MRNFTPININNLIYFLDHNIVIDFLVFVVYTIVNGMDREKTHDNNKYYFLLLA